MKKLLLTIFKGIIFFIGWALLVSFISAPNNENPAVWRFWAELIPFLCMVAVSFLFWLIEKRKICILPVSNPITNCITGVVGGVVWLGASFIILVGTGTLKLAEHTAVSMLWLWIFSALLNTVMQELLVRGYLYQMIKSNYNVAAAACVSSALFTLLHGGAFEAGLIPVLNVLSMSVLMTVVLEYTASLITPIIMHFLWNSIGAVILGGVSLAEDYPHVFTSIFQGSTLLSGGACKMEGSIVVFFINIILIGIFIMLIKKKARVVS